MPSSQSIRNKLSRVIFRVGPMSRTSYLRVVSAVGGDTLIGRGSTLNNDDTLCDPQPVYRQLGHKSMYLSNGKSLTAGDYHFTFPVGQFTESDFQGAETYIVLTDANGEERLRILYANTSSFGGGDIAIFVFARSMGH